MSGRDFEIQKRLKPEPPTPLEEKCMEKIESIDLAIFSHKMHMISIECKENLVKTGGVRVVGGGMSGLAFLLHRVIWLWRPQGFGFIRFWVKSR